MTCKNCIVGTVQFRVKLIGEKNSLLKPLVFEHLERLGHVISEEHETLLLNEEAIKELTDFFMTFGEVDKIVFTVDEDYWQPLTIIDDVLQASWVDTIIAKNRIICYSQPIIQANGNIFGHEVLARFVGENDELLYPAQVFHAAKLRGRLFALDRACRLAAARYGKKLNGKIFINFIPTSIYEPKFCLQSTELLARKLNIEPKQFIFEVVESEEVKDMDHLKRILSYYRDKGFEYALDDVGEGYSTIDLLEEIQPNYMKLDRKYVNGIANDPYLQSMANLFLKKSLDIGAIPLAEGIETKEDFLFLKMLGFQLFQGYLFSKPHPDPVVAIDWQAIS